MDLYYIAIRQYVIYNIRKNTIEQPMSESIDQESDLSFHTAIEEPFTSLTSTSHKSSNGWVSYPTNEGKDSTNSSSPNLGNESIVNDIISRRRNASSGPANNLSQSARRDTENKKLKELRRLKRLQKTIKNRGGLDNMRDFVLNSEIDAEYARLAKEAEQFALPIDELERIEKQKEEDLDDDEILEFIEQRDKYQYELDQILNENIAKEGL